MMVVSGRVLAALIWMISFTLPAFSEDFKKEKVEGYSWKKKEKSHFDIYYRNADKKFIEKIGDKAEKDYWILENKLGIMRTKWKGKIYIYDSREDYLGYTGQSSWSEGFANIVEATITSFAENRHFLYNTLPHELGHIVLFKYLEGREISLCLHEGIAQYVEAAGRRRDYRRIVNISIDKGSFIHLDSLFKISGSELRSIDGKTVSLFYAEAMGIVEYLVRRHGRFKFSSFLRQLKDGEDLASALKWAFSYDSISELNDEWLKFLGR